MRVPRQGHGMLGSRVCNRGRHRSLFVHRSVALLGSITGWVTVWKKKPVSFSFGSQASLVVINHPSLLYNHCTRLVRRLNFLQSQPDSRVFTGYSCSSLIKNQVVPATSSTRIASDVFFKLKWIHFRKCYIMIWLDFVQGTNIENNVRLLQCSSLCSLCCCKCLLI